ncbi:MAG: hypothetical protein SGCHY_003456 [Lobulomycetales sp.]
MRDKLNYFPKISKQQFFSRGFAERKILMLIDIINLLKQHKHTPAPNTLSDTSRNIIQLKSSGFIGETVSDPDMSVLHEPLDTVPRPKPPPALAAASETAESLNWTNNAEYSATDITPHTSKPKTPTMTDIFLEQSRPPSASAGPAIYQKTPTPSATSAPAAATPRGSAASPRALTSASPRLIDGLRGGASPSVVEALTSATRTLYTLASPTFTESVPVVQQDVNVHGFSVHRPLPPASAVHVVNGHAPLPFGQVAKVESGVKQKEAFDDNSSSVQREALDDSSSVQQKQVPAGKHRESLHQQKQGKSSLQTGHKSATTMTEQAPLPADGHVIKRIKELEDFVGHALSGIEARLRVLELASSSAPAPLVFADGGVADKRPPADWSPDLQIPESRRASPRAEKSANRNKSLLGRETSPAPPYDNEDRVESVCGSVIERIQERIRETERKLR